MSTPGFHIRRCTIDSDLVSEQSAGTEIQLLCWHWPQHEAGGSYYALSWPDENWGEEFNHIQSTVVEMEEDSMNVYWLINETITEDSLGSHFCLRGLQQNYKALSLYMHEIQHD
jgi:hypothetical protein